MTIDPIAVAAGLAAGLLLGAVFFGGLWWTVRNGLTSARAPLWFAASYALRIALLAGGLYLVAHEHPVRALAAGAGVLFARAIIVRLGRSAPGFALPGKPQ